jgi:hypothetical protein
MALTKRERVLIERLKKSGRMSRREKVDAPFEVLVRPLATVGVGAGKFALWFEEEISTGVKAAGLTLPLKRIMISPHIIDLTIAAYPLDGVTFRRRENAIFVAVSIDYQTWSRSSENSKLASMYENIKQSLLQIPGEYVGDSGRETLLNIIENAYTKLQSRLAH